MEPLIRVVDLWKRYRDTESRNGAALRGANLSVTSGELVAIYGKSGSGKTSLLNILAGLDYPSMGIVEIEGHNMQSMDEQKKTNLRRSRIGFIFQFFNLLPTLTVFENVFLSLELIGKADRRAVLDAPTGAFPPGRLPLRQVSTARLSAGDPAEFPVETVAIRYAAPAIAPRRPMHV